MLKKFFYNSEYQNRIHLSALARYHFELRTRKRLDSIYRSKTTSDFVNISQIILRTTDKKLIRNKIAIINYYNKKKMPKVDCAVIGCSNNTYKINKCKAESCEKHVRVKKKDCDCAAPF